MGKQIKKRKYKQKILGNFSSVFGIVITFLILLGNNEVLTAIRIPITEVTEDMLRYTFFFDPPILTQVEVHQKLFTRIDINDCFSSSHPGQPRLPIYRALLLLPKGRLVDTIEVTSHIPQNVHADLLNQPILPEQDFIRVGVLESPGFLMNDTLYTQPFPVSETLYENRGVGYCRGYTILTIYLYPVQYIPSAGLLTYFPEMTVTITLQQSQKQPLTGDLSFLRNWDSDETMIRELVYNPSILSTYDTLEIWSIEEYDGSSGTYNHMNEFDGAGRLDSGYSGGLCENGQQFEFVIITSSSLKNTNGYPYNWSSLIAHRKSYSGLNGTIVTVQEIDACQDYWNSTLTFNDSQAHIREFCKDAYLDWKTEYVLLGGDWDSTASHQIVPYRLFTDREETATYKTMACDKYFSHLDGDWYYAPQGIWGGGRNSAVNDYFAELYLGRIAAYNASMVSNAVQKIIWYDLSASGNWLQNISFLGGNLGWTVTSKEYMEELRLGTDTYRVFMGFEEWNTGHPNTTVDTSERIYHADVGSSYKTYFSNSFSNDNASIVNHLDHSDYNSPFGLTNWQSRYNTKPFFGYSQGCLAGRFHAGSAGSEQLQCRHPERHAFALVLNTGYGYASSSSTNGPSQYIQCYFYDYFFNNQSHSFDNWQLGKAHAYAHQKMSARVDISSHAWCYAWYSAHFFGDPAQVLRFQDKPSEVTPEIVISDENPINHAENVTLNMTMLSVTLQHTKGWSYHVTISTIPDIGSIHVSNTTNGTKTCCITNITAGIKYFWFVNATDGITWTNRSFCFSTKFPDSSPPQISNIQLRTSDPMDTQTGFGWENISCIVTDNTKVELVLLKVVAPDFSSMNISMHVLYESTTYYYNTTFIQYGAYSFCIWANDTNNNTIVTNATSLVLAPNWDVDMDGTCSLIDLTTVSEKYAESGQPGWIREDIDNTGEITVFDLVVISNFFYQIWSY